MSKTANEVAENEDQEREKAFLAACLRKGRKPDGALAIYRRLVRTNIINVVFRLLPKTRAQMNEKFPEAFDDALVDFMDELGPRSHHLRDVPAEFLRYAEDLWRKSGVDEGTLDLARYEAASFAVETAPEDGEPIVGEVDLDHGVVFTKAARVVKQGDVWRLLYRDAENDVVEIEIEPFLWQIMTCLREGRTLRDAMSEAAQRVNVTLDPATLQRVAAELADLGQRGVVLGGARR
ncbi:MAG: HvfC/BufC family peptide modification chaperone [Polyangiaceae bacterium]